MAEWHILFVFGLLSVIVGITGSPLPRTIPRTLPRQSSYKFDFVTREEWGGREATDITLLNTPVPLVVIHHSYVPSACFTRSACSVAMQSMQNSHQITNGWNDIGYNFAVGSDGRVYEGRGFDRVGAHSAGTNTISIGIVLIGDWITKVPPKRQLDAAQALIAVGVNLGFIHPEYDLVGHRQVRATECPGDALFKEISTWKRFNSNVNLYNM